MITLSYLIQKIKNKIARTNNSRISMEKIYNEII